MRPLFGVALALAAATASNVRAEQVRVVRYGDDRLAGITAVDVVVQAHAEPDAEACGGGAALPNAAVAALRKTGLTASASAKASSWFYTVYVRIESVLAAGQCASSVETELVAQVQGIPDADRTAEPGAWGSLLVGELSLIRRSAVTASPAATHPGRIEATLRDQLTGIGEKIRAANP